MKSVPDKKPRVALLGVGLDGDDGHTRLTRGDNFVLFGGSDETHSVMQETVVKVNESLDRSGKSLERISGEELRDIFHKAMGD